MCCTVDCWLEWEGKYTWLHARKVTARWGEKEHTQPRCAPLLLQLMYSNLAVWGEQTVVYKQYNWDTTIGRSGPHSAWIDGIWPVHSCFARSEPQADVSHHSKLYVGQVRVYGTVLLCVKKSCRVVVTYFIQTTMFYFKFHVGTNYQLYYQADRMRGSRSWQLNVNSAPPRLRKDASKLN